MRRSVALCALALASAGPAFAQETQAYTYDVHGRLTKVVRTQGATTRTTNYAIDDANNRTSRAITSTTSGSALAEPGATAAERETAAELGPTAASAPETPAPSEGARDDLLPPVDAAPALQASNG